MELLLNHFVMRVHIGLKEVPFWPLRLFVRRLPFPLSLCSFFCISVILLLGVRLPLGLVVRLKVSCKTSGVTTTGGKLLLANTAFAFSSVSFVKMVPEQTLIGCRCGHGWMQTDWLKEMQEELWLILVVSSLRQRKLRVPRKVKEPMYIQWIFDKLSINLFLSFSQFIFDSSSNI